MPRKKRIERFRIKERQNPGGSTGYQVDGVSPSGKRIREQFRNKAEALDRKGQLELEYEGRDIEYALRRTTLSEAALADAETAYEAAGVQQLSSIVTEYLKLQSRLQEHVGINLDKAVRFVEQHYRTEIEELGLHTAAERFLNSRDGIVETTQAFYRAAMKLLQGKLGPNKLVHQITVRELEEILRSYKNLNTRKTYRRGFSVFFNWCVRHHYASENPCDRLDPIPADQSQVSILRLEEVRRLLRAASLYQKGSMAPVIAIGLFAGLRPSEIADLKPADIKGEYMVVSGGKLRRTMNRRVPLSDVLRVWLKQFPFKGLPKGHSYKMKALKSATAASSWVQDIIRHTSISFQLERDKNEATVAFNNGTSGQMIERHYRDVIEDEQELVAFWELTPDKLKGLEVVLPTRQGIDAWPSDAQLAKLVFEKPLTIIGKELGLSDNAVRKRCIARGIVLPKNGYWQRRLNK